MKTSKVTLAGVILTAALAATSVQAGTLTLHPAVAVMGPVTESGQTTVLVEFNLGELPDFQVYQLDEALLEWPVAGLPSDRSTEYALYPITSAWNGESVAATGLPSVAEAPVATWSWGALPAQWVGHGHIRFDLTALFRDWVGGRTDNHGFLIATRDVGKSAFEQDLQTVTVTLRYGRHPQ